MIAEGRGDWTTARAHLAAWLEAEPGSGQARQRLARALVMLGKPNAGLGELEKAVKDDPTLEPAAVMMARFLSQKGDSKAAGTWLDRAAETLPDDPRVQLARAGWLVDQGRPDDAKAPTQALARLAPSSHEVKRLRGMIALHQKDFAEAERQFDALWRESPGDFAARGRLILALAEQPEEAKRRRALDLAEDGARQQPADPEALALLGWANFRLGRLDEAEECFRAALAQGQLGAASAYHYALVLAARGRIEDAGRIIRSTLETSGTFLGREDARKWQEDHPTRRP
jgi:tetratricopeptide (TPR) repeat protein